MDKKTIELMDMFLSFKERAFIQDVLHGRVKLVFGDQQQKEIISGINRKLSLEKEDIEIQIQDFENMIDDCDNEIRELENTKTDYQSKIQALEKYLSEK